MAYVYRDGKLVDKSTGEPLKFERKKKNGGPAYIASDIMSETRHMADNKMYTSKSEFRKTTKAHGCVEIGNDTAPLLKPRKLIQLDRNKRREDIQRAVYELRNR
jgi:hypothetical protein